MRKLIALNHSFAYPFVYSFIGLFVYLFIWPQAAVAAGEFQADYDVDYSVAPTGVTIVTQKVTLTNRQTNFYPKEYSVTIDTEKIREVIARDSSGVIVPTIKQGDGKTQIGLSFNDKVVGLGKTLTFTLRYENLDIAQKHGGIWEVNIPGVAESEDLGAYNVSLQVPSSFGPNAYMSPLPTLGRRWNKEQMIRGGVSAAYGTEQVFLVDLSYYLENSRLVPATTEIAVPPDTAFQKVFIQSLEPKPATVRQDQDGNWLAVYELLGSQRVRVTVKAVITIALVPRSDFKSDPVKVDDYTKTLQYWETGDAKIQQLAKTYKTPRAIYNYVVSTLSYDYNRVNQDPIRKGAALALATPKQSICMEFTDLFIALARAAGIPAREAVGYAYTTNPKLRPLSLVSDVLHAWPEYYDSDKKLWIPVDPTWGNTTGGVNYFDKLDFNHIVFAIHGLVSTSPYPAGFYRQEGRGDKDVYVQFADSQKPENREKLTTTIDFPKSVTAGFAKRGTVIVENTGGVRVETATVAIQVSPFSFSMTRQERDIPPFATLRYPFAIDIPNVFAGANGQISTSVNGDIQNFYFTVKPVYWLYIPVSIMIVGLIFLIWYFLMHVHLWKKSKRG